jgi:hypothetical protein
MTSRPGPDGRNPVVAPVSLAAWQIECCVPPPGVGDEVAWPLSWVPTGADGADRDGFDHVGAHRRTWIAQRRDGGVLLVDPALVAGCSAGSVAQEIGPAGLSGALVAVLHSDGHPVQLPPVHGWVRRVWVTSQLFVPHDCAHGPPGDCWAPAPGSGAARQVALSPCRFAGGLARARPDTPRRAETGVLIDLAVEVSGNRELGGVVGTSSGGAFLPSEEVQVGLDPSSGLAARLDEPPPRWVDPLDPAVSGDELADPCNVLRPGDPCPLLRSARDIHCPARWFDTRILRVGSPAAPWWCVRAAGHPGQHIAGVPGAQVAAVTDATRTPA